MKRNHIIHLILATIAILTASCNQDSALFEDGEFQTYTLYLDAGVPSFEAVHEGETRASGNSWANGDVIFVSYSNGGNTKVSSATYSSSLGAFQFSSTSLSTISDASCSVYYFRGGSSSVSGNTVSMDKYTAIFTDTSAKYTCSNNVITMRAAFKPYTWRLCFKGTAGTEVKLKTESNIVYNTSLNLTSGSFTTKAEDASMQVQSVGYTPYVYGQFTGTINTVKVEVGVSVYSRTISSSKLTIGQSGYYTIPTSSNLNGWTKESGETIEHEYVDLGLPSGTLWATCNIGASKPEEYGGYYAWGETEEKNNYGWDTYIHCDGTWQTCHNIGDDIAGTKYDVAHMKWGGDWRMPTLTQIKELLNNCSKIWGTQNGVYGIRVTGPNGNKLFLPAAGRRMWGDLYGRGSYGYYWSSTHDTGPTYHAYLLYFASDAWYWDQDYRYNGRSVRAVCP